MTNVHVLQGTFENNVYTWTSYSLNNLIQFKDLDHSDLSEYEKIVIPVSNWSDGILKCVIRVKNDEGSGTTTTDYIRSLHSPNPPLKELELGSFENEGGTKITKKQLKHVESVFFGGASDNGSATIGQIYLTKQLDWDENGNITILPQDINCDNVTKNGSSFEFTQLYATVTIDFIGDGISAKKLASASSSENNQGFNFYYCIDDNFNHDKLSTSELSESNVKKVKYVYQNEGSKTITINNFVLKYKDPITVTLKAENGTINGQKEKTIKYCETPITLPAATPNDPAKVFNAWRYIDNKGDGSHVGNAGDKYTPTGNITLTAHYTNKTLYYNNTELGNCLGDYTKTVPTNTVFTPNYSISNGTQKEFTFNCNRPQSGALNAFWYGWIMWAKPSSAIGNVNDKPFYFWTNAQDTRYATDASTGIWDNSISSDIKISKDGKLYDMTPEERNTYLSDMGKSAQVTVKVAYFDNTIRMYAVIKSSDETRTYVQAYEYKDKGAYINNATSIDVYFSVDHAYLTNFIDKEAVSIVTATGNVDSGTTGTGTVKIYTTEGYDIHNPAKVGKYESVVFEAVPDAGCKFTKWGGSGILENPRTLKMEKDEGPYATFVKALETITVDKNIREYGIYVPEVAKNAGEGTIPVIISLHGRDGKVDPDNGENPNFNSIATTNNIIVVYPQGRNGGEKPNDWNNGFVGTTGWEATGKENGDTRFIEELVKEIKTKYPQADPKRFYLCGFSMGGMMTYACAKVLNGTFAAYGSCGGFPLNEFHLNLATKQPVPFMHLHGDADGVVGINHLHTIIENLLFRNGCKLSQKQNNDDGWTKTTENGMTRYDFKGVNGVPVTTVTFKDLGHLVHASAPQYLWDFFSPKTLDTYMPTTMKWQWDMKTINSNLSASNGYPYGWERVAVSETTHGTLTYGNNRKGNCSIQGCIGATNGCNGNHNVYNSIQLEKGIYKLHAKAHVVSSDATGIIVGIYKVGAKENSGKCIIRRQVKNNSGEASADLSILYPFAITEDGEYYVKVERGNNQTTCTALAIHTNEYAPTEEDDSEAAPELTSGWENDGLIVKIDFEEEGKDCAKIGEEMTATYHTDNFSFVQFKEDAPESGYKLYNLHRADNIQTWDKSAVIQKDEIFGYYFQNIPKAQFYDRSAAQNYMRAVLPKKALSPIKDSGAATIGFWVNGRVAVDAGLSYFDASMLYLSGPYHSAHYAPTEDNGNEASDKQYQSMFNIRCNGNTNGFLKNASSKQVRYYANNMFGDLCDNNTHESYYKKNLYLDRNWHYITMVMSNGLRNVDMYVDGELTQSRQNIVGSGQDLTAGLDTINHIIIGGLNATYTEFTYDPAFAFDDIVIYSRALTPQEIQAIITAKKYSPNSWDFEKNIANTALLNKDKLKDSYWTYDQVNDVYTLIKKLDTPAELTYDGNRVIPAFRGLKFKTTGTDQIKIDMAKKRLIVVGQNNDNVDTNDPQITISNAPVGQYLRCEFDKSSPGWLSYKDNLEFKGDINISNNSKTGVIKVTKQESETSNLSSCIVSVFSNEVALKSIGTTDKIFADLTFGTLIADKTDYTKTETIEWVKTDEKYPTLPNLYLFENGIGYNKVYNYKELNSEDYKGKITFWSSAPHVAYVKSAKTTDNQPDVVVTGVPGSAYIYAELENNNQYDCNTDDADLYASSNRIIARYEIHVPNEVQNYSVKISNDTDYPDDNYIFNVGNKLKTKDDAKAVTLTLGGWNYNGNSYFGSTDGYTKKETWKGMPLNKTTNDTKGYQSVYDVSDKSGNYTDDNTYSGLGYYTGGTHAAKSEQLNDTGNKGLFVTEYANNSTAWTLPCRGSYAKVEPTEAGIISVYVLQEGCMERNMTGTEQTYFDSYKVAAYEPYDINIKKVYVADEAGNIIDKVITDTKSKIVSQVWKDDGRARAEYSYYMPQTAYSELLHQRFMENIVNAEENPVALLDKWNSPGMTQNIIPYRKGYAVIDKGIVRYTFNVLPGKTYYIFSNDAKMGIAGFNFTKDKQLNFKYDDKINAYTIDEYNPLAGDLTRTEPVTLNDGVDDDYSVRTEKNVDVTLNRTFYKNYWNAICLPYSINRRQIEKVFGDGTMVVLMNYIDTSNKKVMFIEHANQDIIAGYPYLIFPTKKDDNDKTNHDPIPGITTRATFGEADSPLFSVGTDGETYTPGKMQPNALVFKGTFSQEELPVGSYVITKSGTLANVPKTGLKINPYRAYIHFNKTTSGAKAIKLASMGFAGIDDMEGETTSIEDLLFNDGIMTRPADVFTVNGQKVRSKAENLYGLPKGMYIVNGKKYVNK